MRRVMVLFAASLAVAACNVSTDLPQARPVGAGGTAAPGAAAAPNGASAATTGTQTDGTTGKGQPAPTLPPVQPPSAQPAPPSAQPPPPSTPTPVSTPRPLFNDQDADNVNGAFVPSRSDGDGQG